jgi:hypothetical protein
MRKYRERAKSWMADVKTTKVAIVILKFAADEKEEEYDDNWKRGGGAGGVRYLYDNEQIGHSSGLSTRVV